jgi:hypothetical protein
MFRRRRRDDEPLWTRHELWQPVFRGFVPGLPSFQLGHNDGIVLHRGQTLSDSYSSRVGLGIKRRSALSSGRLSVSLSRSGMRFWVSGSSEPDVVPRRAQLERLG